MEGERESESNKRGKVGDITKEKIYRHWNLDVGGAYGSFHHFVEETERLVSTRFVVRIYFTAISSDN